MKLIKRILGFNSSYSWVKWLRMSFALCALIIVFLFWYNYSFIVLGGGIFGLILAVILFLIVGGPILLVMLGISLAVGSVIGIIISRRKQSQSLEEIIAAGSPELMEVENLRRKSQRLDLLFILTLAALIIPGMALVFPLSAAFGEFGPYVYLFLAAIVLIVFAVLKAPANQRYKRAFKEQIVTKELEAVLDHVNFRPEESLKESQVRESGLFPVYNLFSGNDYVEADYKGHHFIQSDIRLQQEKEETYLDDEGDIQTRTVYETIFCGRLMIFEYDAISNEPVAVYDRQGGRRKSNEAVQTELDSFNQKFYVIAPSPTAALRILTPPVLESIVLASGKLGHPLFLSFRGDKLYVALANGDSFEAAGGDVTLSEQRRRVTGEIRLLLELIDTLYLKRQL